MTRSAKQAKPAAKRKLAPVPADRLKQTVDGLNALIPRTEDGDERCALRNLRRESFRQWETAMRLHVAGFTPEFAAAAKALQTANREIAAAKKDLARIARAIELAAAAAKLADRALHLAMKAM